MRTGLPSPCSLPLADAASAVERVDYLRDIEDGLVRVFDRDPDAPTYPSSWRTSTVVELARQTYESRDFSPMPVLANTLQDAGCEEEAILAHCRGDGPHVRGCRVVDLVLGKSQVGPPRPPAVRPDGAGVGPPVASDVRPDLQDEPYRGCWAVDLVPNES